MSTPDPIETSANHIACELEKAIDWKRDLLAELRRAETRIDSLSTSLETLVPMLPEPARGGMSDRLGKARKANAMASGASLQGSDRMQVLHDFLAHHPGVMATTAAVRTHLHAHGHRLSPGAVARMLHAKTVQGVLRRVGRGQFAILRDHPVLAGLRQKETVTDVPA